MAYYISRSSTFKRLGLSGFALLAAVSSVFLTSHVAMAQEVTLERQFSEEAGKIVNETLGLITADQHSEVIEQLSSLLSGARLNAYERSTIYQMKGASYYELNNYAAAIDAFENAVQAGGLLPEEVKSLKLNIAQLNIASGKYRKGAEALENHFMSGGATKPQYVEILVQAWIQAGDYSKALQWAEQWFNAANPKARRHYDLMNFLYARLDMKDYQADIISQMITRWPDDISLKDARASISHGSSGQ